MMFPKVNWLHSPTRLALTAFIMAGLLLAHTQRVEAQGATSVESIGPAESDTIAVQLDASGNPAILFDGTKVSCSDPNCSFPAIDTFFDDFPDRQLRTIRVGFDAKGFPYLLFGSRFAPDRFPPILVRCLDLGCDSVITHEYPELPGGSVMTLREDRLAMFAYQNEGTDKLKLAHCVDLECTSLNMIRTIAPVGRPVSINVDNDGNPIIVFKPDDNLSFDRDGDAGWLIARCYDLACSAPTLTELDVTGEISSMLIAVNSSDQPVFSFLNGDTFREFELKVLQCDDPNCATSSTRTIDKARVRPVMELDENGFPVLAFRKSGTVRLARCYDDACATLSVEVVGEGSGGAPTLTLDELSHPVLAYRDARLGSLKLARCGNASCLPSSGVLPDPGSYNLRSVATGRYLDADRNGSIGTSRVPKPDDVWNLDLAVANVSLPFTLANREFETSLKLTNWVLEDAGDGTYYVRRISTSTNNYLSTNRNRVSITTRNLSDRWEFIPVN